MESVDQFFQNELFATGFGIVLWFAIHNSIYSHKFKTFWAWFVDQADEMFIACMIGILIIYLDNSAVAYLHEKYPYIPELDKIIHFLSGPATVGVIKLAKKLFKK